MKQAVLPLVLCVAGGLWWQVSRGGKSPAAGGGLEAEAARVDEVERRGERGGATRTPELGGGASTGRELAAREIDSAAEVAVAPTLESTGEVVLVDHVGNEHHGLDGELDLLLSSGERVRKLHLPVREGRFTFHAAADERVGGVQVVLDGHPQGAEEWEGGLGLDGSPLVVRLRLPPRTILSVLDDASGAHLSGVRVVSVGGQLGMRLGPRHPGRPPAERVLIEDGVSPVELRPGVMAARVGSASLLVHSPGYAWEGIQLDLSGPGERELRLSPGGDLRVDVVGPVPEQGVALRLRRLDAGNIRPTCEFALAGPSSIAVDGLVPGSYLVLAEIGDWWREPASCGTVEVEVVAGERRRCTLAFESPAPVDRARMAGTLVLPAAWALEEFRLIALYDEPATREEHLRILEHDHFRALEGERDAWAFDFGEVPVGGYELRLRSWDLPTPVVHPWRVELVPGAPPERLEVPPPVDVAVRILDATDGSLAKLDSIRCGVVPPGEPNPLFHEFVKRDSLDAPFRLRAPAGELRVLAGDRIHEFLFETARISPGENELEFRLQRGFTLRVVLLDGETPVPIPPEIRIVPEALGGDGVLRGAMSDATGRTLGLSAPGRYRITLPPFDGYAPTQPQEVEVLRGETPEVVFRLERE